MSSPISPRCGTDALRLDRRTLLAGATALALVEIRPARATPEESRAAIRDFAGGVEPRAGRVTLDAPPLVENGNSVALAVTVDSAMSADDHVRRIALFNEKNPQPHIAVFHLGPRAGKASVATRMRMADSQTIVAVAELSDGSFWQASAEIIVTIAACIEE